jgi:hypothetical protein
MLNPQNHCPRLATRPLEGEPLTKRDDPMLPAPDRR